jgi:hypothetical protein
MEESMQITIWANPEKVTSFDTMHTDLSTALEWLNKLFPEYEWDGEVEDE